jgi:hypothetical protein
MPYKMLYGKKPNLAGLREWGMKVWVHDASGTKLDGRSRIRQWIGFEEASNAHRIYWLDNRSVTVEQSIKFNNNNLLIPHALPPKGEKGDTGCQSTQDSTTTSIYFTRMVWYQTVRLFRNRCMDFLACWTTITG